jgi:hypothetical protein
MRMIASWFDPQRIDRIQGRGARSAPHLDGELASDFVGCNWPASHVTSNQVPALCDSVLTARLRPGLRKVRTNEAKWGRSQPTHPAGVLAGAVKDAARR